MKYQRYIFITLSIILLFTCMACSGNAGEILVTDWEILYDYARDFEDRKPMVYHLNASVTYRINKRKHASIWSLQILNALGTEEFYGYQYNYRTETIEEGSVRVVVPSIAYKIEF